MRLLLSCKEFCAFAALPEEEVVKIREFYYEKGKTGALNSYGNDS